MLQTERGTGFEALRSPVDLYLTRLSLLRPCTEKADETWNAGVRVVLQALDERVAEAIHAAPDLSDGEPRVAGDLAKEGELHRAGSTSACMEVKFQARSRGFQGSLGLCRAPLRRRLFAWRLGRH